MQVEDGRFTCSMKRICSVVVVSERWLRMRVGGGWKIGTEENVKWSLVIKDRNEDARAVTFANSPLS